MNYQGKLSLDKTTTNNILLFSELRWRVVLKFKAQYHDHIVNIFNLYLYNLISVYISF